MHTDRYRSIPNDESEAELNELAEHARDDADLFGQMAAWLRELLPS